jgi:adenylate cyclase
MTLPPDVITSRPIVEWFAQVDRWRTCRKSVWLSALFVFMQVATGTVALVFLSMWGGIDAGRLAWVIVGGIVAGVLTYLASLVALRSAGEGQWTAYLIIVVYGVWISALVQVMGSWSTPFFIYYPLAVVLMALCYGERVGWFAFVIGGIMLCVREVLERTGLIDYAPALVDRSVDSQNSVAWATANSLVVMPTFAFAFFISMLVVATRRLQDRRLHQANDQIRRSNELIARYAPREIAERILAGEHSADYRPERLKLTVVFADVVGFTDSSDEMDPEELADFLNDYLAQMSDIVERHGTTINQFLGDGIMVIFGAPYAGDDRDNAVRAVQMATEMQDSIPTLNETWLRRGGRHGFQIRIGINTGYASVGDYGSPGRKAYSAIGVQINIAERIQSECRPGKVLVSDTTWTLVNDEFVGTDLGEVTLKGIHFPVQVYEIEPAADVTPAPL